MELLNNCRDYAHTYYGNLLLAAEKNIVEALFKHSDQAANNDEQRRFYDAMQQFRRRSPQMHDAFALQLSKCFQRFVDGEIASDKRGASPDELSLVNSQKLEDDLAISVIVSKSNSRYSEILWKLNRRLAVLRSGTPVHDEDNPFAPAMVGEAMQVAVSSLKLDAQTRLLVYKLLGKLFIIGFDKALKRIDQQLVDKGILPNLKFLANRDEEKSLAPKVLTDPDLSRESAASIQNQRRMYETIKLLQSNIGPRTHTMGGVSLAGIPTDGASAEESFGEMDYALALSAVQQSKEMVQAATTNQAMPAEEVEKKVVDQLLKQGNDKSRHKMSQDDADTVDLVGMIFRYILDDRNLCDAVKSLLSHLHTPYLKLALMDKTFVNNYEHSARILVNSLADVGGRWVKDETDRTVLPKLRMVVETIIKGFVDDYTIFDRLLEDFQRFRENLEKRAKMVQRRNTESQQGMERLELSRQKAEEEVLLRFEKGEIPEQAAAVLQKPWTDFLSFNLLRHGDEGVAWQSALKVVDAVVWSIQKKQAVDNKQDFHRRQQEFETNIKEGLLAMGYDPEASTGLLNGLREAQELAYHGVVLDDKSDMTPPKPERSSASSVAGVGGAKKETAIQKQKSAAKKTQQVKLKKLGKKPKVQLSAAEQQQLDSLKDIAFGTWFDFLDENNTPERLKLAWYSRVTSNYMFVNNAGVKQTVITRIDLAKSMVAGGVTMVSLEKRSFMERALETVLNKLKPKASAAAVGG